MTTPFRRTGWIVIAADGAMKLRDAATASGTPIECPPPSTSDTVGFFIPAIISAMPSPASTSPPTVFRSISSLLGLLDRREQRHDMLIFCGFVILGQYLMPLDLTDDSQAVYHSCPALRLSAAQLFKLLQKNHLIPILSDMRRFYYALYAASTPR